MIPQMQITLPQAAVQDAIAQYLAANGINAEVSGMSLNEDTVTVDVGSAGEAALKPKQQRRRRRSSAEKPEEKGTSTTEEHPTTEEAQETPVPEVTPEEAVLDAAMEETNATIAADSVPAEEQAAPPKAESTSLFGG